MTVNYVSTSEEAIEPQIRFFFRGPDSEKWRIRNALKIGFWVSVGTAVACTAVAPETKSALIPILVTGFVAGATINHFRWRQWAEAELRTVWQEELGGVFPAPTTYEVAAGFLSFTRGDVTLRLPLPELERIEETLTHLELVFRARGLFAIPIRAFASSTSKAHFMEELKREQPRAAEPSSAGAPEGR